MDGTVVFGVNGKRVPGCFTTPFLFEIKMDIGSDEIGNEDVEQASPPLRDQSSYANK
jgi:hypothetical protein